MMYLWVTLACVVSFAAGICCGFFGLMAIHSIEYREWAERQVNNGLTREESLRGR